MKKKIVLSAITALSVAALGSVCGFAETEETASFNPGNDEDMGIGSISAEEDTAGSEDDFCDAFISGFLMGSDEAAADSSTSVTATDIDSAEVTDEGVETWEADIAPIPEGTDDPEAEKYKDAEGDTDESTQEVYTTGANPGTGVTEFSVSAVSVLAAAGTIVFAKKRKG